MQQETTATMKAPTTATPQRREPNPYGGNFMLTPSLMEYLTPDLTLPEQYYMRHQGDDGMGPERALMYAVLKDAIRSFYKNVGATRRKYKKVLLEAESSRPRPGSRKTAGITRSRSSSSARPSISMQCACALAFLPGVTPSCADVQ
jgi:hypothetical protein